MPLADPNKQAEFAGFRLQQGCRHPEIRDPERIRIVPEYLVIRNQISFRGTLEVRDFLPGKPDQTCSRFITGERIFTGNQNPDGTRFPAGRTFPLHTDDSIQDMDSRIGTQGNVC